MKKLINLSKAFIRLSIKNEKKKEISEAADTILKSLYRKNFNDTERAKIMEIANIRLQDKLLREKEIKMLDHLDTEKAFDIMRVVNLKYT